MKPISFSIPKIDQYSIHVQEDYASAFYNHLHIHPEIQIMWIKKGRGTIICGDYIGDYAPGDIYIIGSNVPHIFKTIREENEENSHAFSIFTAPFLVTEFLFSQGDRAIGDNFMSESLFGLRVKKQFQQKISELMLSVFSFEGIHRIVSFGKLIQYFIEERPYLKCGLIPAISVKSSKDNQRFQKILNWMMENYSNRISLAQAADHAALSIPAFCNYFKKRTGKTFVDYLNEIRINHACQLLISGDLPISIISELSGFNNISLFNRKFKEIKEIAPRDYRNSMKKG